MIECREFIFSGQVQGIGFRWTAKGFADRLRLSGWVRNNPDGGVTMVAKGDAGTIDRLIEDIDDRFGPYIEKVASRDCKDGNFDDGFTIKG